MVRRVCYIHAGPHKSGTTAIQWFLRENRPELLKHGYFVPESGTVHGGHHSLARKLCGQAVPDHQQSVDAAFVQMLCATACNAVVISSEHLEELLSNAASANVFFNRIRELNLEPKLILFPRNQSQLLNSRYAQVVQGFRRSESFEAFVRAEIHHPNFRYAQWIDFADSFGAELIARPFTRDTAADGVVPEFLRTIGLDPSRFGNTGINRNRAAGPFAVSVARGVLRSIAVSGQRLTWLQGDRCKKKLAAYLEQNGLADTGYCGLTTAVARHIEKEWQSANDMFAQRVWEKSWAEVFAGDIAEEFLPNDFDIRLPDFVTRRRLKRAIREMKPIVEAILKDPALVVKASWNDLRQRSGWIAKVNS
jgi:hypothetical protein